MGANAVDMMDENDRIAKASFKHNSKVDEEDTLNIYFERLPVRNVTENDLAFAQSNPL